MGGLIPTRRQGNIMEACAALYVHVGQPNSFVAAGQYGMSSDQLAKYRAAVADAKRGKELDKILTALEKKGFAAHSHENYQRVPKGYDPEPPPAEPLKRKGLPVAFPPLPRGILASKKLVPWLVTNTKAAAPLVE